MRLRVNLPESAFEWESSGGTFRVGRGDSCALRVEGESAKFASWEHAEFSERGDGAAFVADLASSNGTYVNGSRIANPVPLSVGSVVQIGRAGPRLEVLAISPGTARPAPVTQNSAPFVNVTPAGQPKNTLPGRLVLAGIAGMIVVVGFLIANLALSKNNRKIVDSSAAQSSQRTIKKNASNPGDSKESVSPGPASIKPLPSPPPPLDPPKESPAALPDEAQQPALAAYRLIVVEDPQAHASWPLAGAVVVGERVLLSTASVAVELTKYLDRGFNLAAMRPRQETTIRISDRRIHAAFQSADPEEQLYFDMALLYADEPLGEAIELASPEELELLKQRGPVSCIAVDHNFEVIDRFQELDPQEYAGNIFAVTELPPQPGPRLLHVRGKFSDKCAGSPIVNQRGRLIALYCEPAPSDGAAGGLGLHYAKVIEPALIEKGLNNPDDSIWVPVNY